MLFLKFERHLTDESLRKADDIEHPVFPKMNGSAGYMIVRF